jgi:hypothetical protein
MSADLQSALAGIPDWLRHPLIKLYTEALTEYRGNRWEAVGIKAGKLCEVVYTILHGHVSGAYAARPSKPPNMVDDCVRLAQHNKTHGRALCIQIPRILIAVYELRNNRDVGHVGSDVDPNAMDAAFFIRAIKWIVAELVRNFNSATVEDAQQLVDAVTQRTFGAVWEKGDVKRVLDPSMGVKDRILLLLYAAGGEAMVKDLCSWAEYSNPSRLRSDVLKDIHIKALIHFDRANDVAHLLPQGISVVEERLLN